MNTLTAGTPAPAFSLPDQDGNIVSLGDFKGKKVLFLLLPKSDDAGLYCASRRSARHQS